MMKIKASNYILQLTLIVLIFSACKKPLTVDNNNIIVEVGSAKLYKSDIAQAIRNEFVTEQDSIQWASEFINKWVKQQLLVAEAEKTLAYSNPDIQQELEQYRQELLIHKYKQFKFEKMEGSSIEPEELKEYYTNNSKLFILDHSIVQVKYIIFPSEIELTRNFKQNLISKQENEITESEDFIFKFAKKYDNFNNEWLYFDYLKELTSLDITDNGKYLKKNNIIEVAKETELHIIVINKYMLPGEQAPIEFVSSKINSLILNRKKLDFLREIKDSLYNDALKYNKFRVFNQ